MWIDISLYVFADDIRSIRIGGNAIGLTIKTQNSSDKLGDTLQAMELGLNTNKTAHQATSDTKLVC